MSLGVGNRLIAVYAVLHRLEDVTRYRAADLYQRGFRSLCGYAGSRPLRGGGEDAGAIAE